MKNLLLVVLVMVGASVSMAQEKSESRALGSFHKVIASPHISVVLIKGEKESISLVCSNIAPEKVNVRVKGGKLHLYLDHARIVEKQWKVNENGNHYKKGIYHNVTVTAYVTYRELSALEIRGEGEIVSDTEITTDKLKLRAYGECDIHLASLNTKKFKASLYGEHTLKIASGTAVRQVYRIFGESKIDSQGLQCANANVRMIGEGRVKLNATDEVHLSAIGEPNLTIHGTAVLNQGLVIGRAVVEKL